MDHEHFFAEKIAELKGMPLEKVEAVTSLNAERWLRLPL